MGLYDQGILGPFRNKTGTVVGAYWRTLNVMRAMPRKNGKAPSEAQLHHRTLFAMVIAIVNRMRSAVNDGYKTSAKVATQMNLAVRDNLKNAVIGTGLAATIDLTKLSFSKGPIDTPENPTVVAGVGKKVVWTWDYDESVPYDDFQGPDDLVTVVVYSATLNKFAIAKGAASRETKTYTQTLPNAFVGEEVQCYMCMNSVKWKPKTSDSVFVGEVTVV